MNRWITDLLHVPPNLTSEAWHLALARVWPTWITVLLIASLGVVAWWSYKGLRGHPTSLLAIRFLRWCTLTLLLVLLMGPMVEWPRERHEQDWVYVLMDRSASMQVRDERDKENNFCSRDATAQALAADPIWKKLSKEHGIAWMALAGSASPIADPHQLPAADGARTLLAASLHEVLQRSASRPTSAIIIVSDGRSQDTVPADMLRRLSSQGAPVFAVALGDPHGATDRAVVEAEFPARAFPKDQVPVQVTVTSGDDSPIRVALREKATGRILDEFTGTPGQDKRMNTTLTGDRKDSGESAWEVVLLPEGQDSDASNDTMPVTITFVDHPLRVLYVDGWPRWEYRYLKNLLLREEGFESAVMLLSADRDFAQEGTSPLTRLPLSPIELDPFDVIIIGDVPSGFLDDNRQRMFREHVARRGAGMLWIGGSRSTPSSWQGTPLQDLLPFRGSLELERWDEPVTMEPTELAHRLGLLRLGDGDQTWPTELGSTGERWAQMEWAQRLDPRELKPTVETWANAVSANPSQPTGIRSFPVVVSMRFGAGTSAYVATDETWRWRFGRGETLPERFWIQIIRHLARGSLRAHQNEPTLEANPASIVVDQPTRVTLDGTTGVDAERVIVEARRADGAEVIEITLLPEGDGRYSAPWSPTRDGEWSLHVAQPPLYRATDAQLRVRSEEPERLNASPDHAALQQLVDATGGKMIAVNDIGSLAELAPHRAITIRQPIQLPLWDRWPVYALIGAMLVIEWLGRRLLRLT